MIDQKFTRLQDVLIDFRMELDLCNPPKDHVPSQPIELVAIIEAHEREGIISRGQRVLELGSGTGSAAFSFNYRGYNVVGYELIDLLVERANELKRRLLTKGLINSDLECDFRHGSYFPREYLEVMRQQRLRGIPTSEERGIRMEANESSYLRIEPGSITPTELMAFDIFYAFPWRSQMPSMVELFSLYARKDAVLLFMLPGWTPVMDSLIQFYGVRKAGGSAFVKY